MAAAAILGIQICEMLLADGVWRTQTHNCTKFRQNRSFRCGDIAIFWIFKMAAAAILVFWNRKILLVVRIQRVETHLHAKFCQNCQSIAKILRFFDFSRWRPPPFWIFKFVKFYWLTVSGGPRHITVPNFVTIVVPLQRYCDFSNFQNGRRRHLGFLKSRNFISY